MNWTRLLTVATAIATYSLLGRYAQPLDQAFASFCIGWTASDIARGIIHRRARRRIAERAGGTA